MEADGQRAGGQTILKKMQNMRSKILPIQSPHDGAETGWEKNQTRRCSVLVQFYSRKYNSHPNGLFLVGLGVHTNVAAN